MRQDVKAVSNPDLGAILQELLETRAHQRVVSSKFQCNYQSSSRILEFAHGKVDPHEASSLPDLTEGILC